MELIDIEINFETTPYFSPETPEEFSSCVPVVDSPYIGWDTDVSERFGTGSEFLAATRKEKRGFTR